MPDKGRRWKEFAERVIRCRACASVWRGSPLFYPDPGWGNLNADVFVIGVNPNWGVARAAFPRTPDGWRTVRGLDRLPEVYDPASGGWDLDRLLAPSRTGVVRAAAEEIAARITVFREGPYDKALYSILAPLLGRGRSHADWRVSLWERVYWSNAVRCQSRTSAEIAPEEFWNCFYAKSDKAPGNVLREEFELVDPHMIVLFGFPTIASGLPDGAQGRDRIEALGMSLAGTLGLDREGDLRFEGTVAKEEMGMCRYRSVGAEKRTCAVFLRHPSSFRPTSSGAEYWSRASRFIRDCLSGCAGDWASRTVPSSGQPLVVAALPWAVEGRDR